MRNLLLAFLAWFAFAAPAAAVSITPGNPPTPPGIGTANTILANGTSGAAKFVATPIPDCHAATSFLQSTQGAGSALLSCGAVSIPQGFAQSYTTSTTPTAQSTSFLMAGFALSATPVTTGRLQVNFSCSLQVATAVTNAQIQIRYGTGTAPVNGVAATGTVAGAAQLVKASGVAAPTMIGSVVVVTGLTSSTAYWFDLAYDTPSTTADALQLNACNVTIVEI